MDQGAFPGFQWMQDGNFKLLGAPFGSQEYCEVHSLKRVDKAVKLLAAIRGYDDLQGGLLLLRHCGSWSKLVYSARTVPPAMHAGAMTAFRQALRQALEDLVGDGLTERSWEVAQLAISNGGLGIRDPVRHAGAAYLGSLAHATELCAAIDSHFDPSDSAGGCTCRLPSTRSSARRWRRQRCKLRPHAATTRCLRRN